MDREEVVYAEGHHAHYCGHGLRHNPYKRFTPDWSNWRTGWLDEQKDDPYWENTRKAQRRAKRNTKKGTPRKKCPPFCLWAITTGSFPNT